MKKAIPGAIALSWNPQDSAPRISARGERAQAARLLSLAREAGVPVFEDPDLWELLSGSYPGDYIPYECWEAVAALLAFVRRCSFSPERTNTLQEGSRLYDPPAERYSHDRGMHENTAH